jgi:hypothetical protein
VNFIPPIAAEVNPLFKNLPQDWLAGQDLNDPEILAQVQLVSTSVARNPDRQYRFFNEPPQICGVRPKLEPRIEEFTAQQCLDLIEDMLVHAEGLTLFEAIQQVQRIEDAALTLTALREMTRDEFDDLKPYYERGLLDEFAHSIRLHIEEARQLDDDREEEPTPLPPQLERALVLSALSAIDNRGQGVHYDDWLRIGRAQFIMKTSPMDKIFGRRGANNPTSTIRDSSATPGDISSARMAAPIPCRRDNFLHGKGERLALGRRRTRGIRHL